jgi:hypothetical protein
MTFQFVFAVCFVILICILSVWMLVLLRNAKRSIFWPRIKAKITYCKVSVATGSDNINNNWSINLVYAYNVRGIEYKSSRYFFGSKVVGFSTKRMIELEEKFKSGEYIDISYNPSNPEIATIEAGIHKNLQVGGAIVFFLLLISIQVLITSLS